MMLNENKKMRNQKEIKYKDEQISKKNRIEEEIIKLTNDLNKVNIKTKDIENIKKNDIQLNSKYDELKNKVNTANEDELIKIENNELELTNEGIKFIKKMQKTKIELAKMEEQIKEIENLGITKSIGREITVGKVIDKQTDKNRSNVFLKYYDKEN